MLQFPKAALESLPMPLWLRGAVCCPVVLDETYARTYYEQRLTSNSP
jgi:hypothetical protein